MLRKAASIAFVFVLLFSEGLFARDSPVSRGALILSGKFTLNLASGDSESDEKSEVFILSPSIMCFIRQNLAIGGEFDIENYSLYGLEVSQVAIGPQIGFYFGHGPRKTYPYFDFSIRFLSAELEDTHRSYGMEYRFGAGVIDFVAKNIAVRGGLELRFQHLELSREVAYYPPFKLSAVESSQESKSGQTMLVTIGLSYFIF